MTRVPVEAASSSRSAVDSHIERRIEEDHRGSLHAKARRAVRHVDIITAFALLLALASTSLALAKEPLQATQRAVVFSPTKLRAYGILSGTFTPSQLGGRAAGALQIVCQDREKARLVLAKYLSDLKLLPGVAKAKDAEIRDGKTRLTVYAVEGQGFVIAARCGTTVWILAAPSRER